MNRCLSLVAILVMTPGCATTQLAFTATRQMSTAPDIYTEQVLDNLARISTDPTAMPYFTLLNSGVPSIGDKGTVSVGSLMYPAQSVVSQIHRQRGGQLGPLGVERDVGSNWTISPINEPGRLSAMRYLYLWVLGKPISNRSDADTLLKQYIGNDFVLDSVPRGWFRCGGRHDVPREACRTFHHHGTHYWIVPGMEEQLTKLTMTTLGMATVIPRTPQRPTQTVTWKINNKTGTTEVTVTRVLEYTTNDKLSRIPETPVHIVTQTEAPAASANVTATPSQPIEPNMAAPAGAPSDSPREYLNNYTNPLVSPGLFSQPR